MKKAKKLTPMQIHSAVREALLNNHEFEAKVVEYDFCKWVRKTQNGYFTVTITTTCEGSVIGTFMISYTTANDEYDVHSGFICMNDKPEWIVRDIINHTDPNSADDYESVDGAAWEIITCPNCCEIVDGFNKQEYNELCEKDRDGSISYECSRCGLNFSVEVK